MLTGNATTTISVIADVYDETKGALRMYAGTSNGKIATSVNALDAAPVWTDMTGSYPGGNVSDLVPPAVAKALKEKYR